MDRPLLCHCFCAVVHGDEMGVCDQTTDVVYVELPPPNRWARAVPMCEPCRAARTRARQ